jgi:large repetitive protein
VTSSRNPSTVGQNVTFTAKVSPVNGGKITFTGGGKALCRAVTLTKVSTGTYRATCATKTLAAGRRTITAVYPGDAKYGASTGTLAQTVTKVATALKVRVVLDPQSAFVLTATLTEAGHPLGAQPVSFSTGTSLLCAPQTDAQGVATCVLTGPEAVLAQQDHGAIKASYAGSTTYRPSKATTVLP